MYLHVRSNLVTKVRVQVLKTDYFISIAFILRLHRFHGGDLSRRTYIEVHGRGAANLGSGSRGLKGLKTATKVYRLENVGDCCWKIFPAPFFRDPSAKKKAKLNGDIKSLLQLKGKDNKGKIKRGYDSVPKSGAVGSAKIVEC